MHLDGCHFYVWVHRDPDGQVVLSYSERVGTDLRYHGRFGADKDGACDRCRALRSGASAKSISLHIAELPEGAQESFARVLTIIAEIEDDAANSQSEMNA